MAIDIIESHSEWTSIQEAAIGALLAEYHLQTEAEKGQALDAASDLPERYRTECHNLAPTLRASTVLIAKDDDTQTASGCAVLRFGTATATISRLWVRPWARGRGHARSLTEAAADLATTANSDRLDLTVWEWRVPARALYESLGFTVQGVSPGRPGLITYSAALPLGRSLAGDSASNA